MLQLIELMALVFTNGLKCRNKCDVASIPYFCFPTGLVISQCNLEEKLELLHLLEKDSFAVRFKKLLHSVQTDELNLEDITQEVEAVR